MATTDLTKIHEVCIVSPSDSPSQLSLPLTFLDMFWLPLDPVSRLFFYEFPEPNTDFLNIVLPKLKKSLSLTLRHYLPVAGHLTWPQDAKFQIILYKSRDGVSLTIAETQYNFHTLSGDEFRDNKELRSLLPEFLTSETQAPVITLQITLFPNIGFSIGYVAHHGVMDGKSVSLFMHSWAYICKNGDSSILPLELTPSLDRSFVEQQSELEKIYPRSFGNPIDSESRALTIANTNFPLDVMLGTFRLGSNGDIKFKHVLRDGNSCADLLAKQESLPDLNSKSLKDFSPKLVALLLMVKRNYPNFRKKKED